MTSDEFKDIIYDIERHLEPGEAYTLDIETPTMKLHGYFWGPIRNHRCSKHADVMSDRVIVLSKDDQRPFYVALSSIECICLGSR